MKKKHAWLFVPLFLFVFPAMRIQAQTHNAVPLDDSIYFFLEQAELRALCPPLPSVKPYQRETIIHIIDEILLLDKSRGLSETERVIFENARKKLAPAEKGFDTMRGTYTLGRETKGGTRLSAEVGVGSSFLSSGAYYFGDKAHGGFDLRLNAHVAGDIGSHLSFGSEIEFAMFYVNRPFFGEMTNWDENGVKVDSYPVYGNPPAYFPFTYKSRWDGWVSNITNISSSGMVGWPHDLGVGYGTTSEISGAAFDDIFTFRLGRLDREWAAMTNGSSLVLNSFAQPFFGMEFTISPFSWFSFSSLSGILEYYNEHGIQDSSMSFQNAFSIIMFELNYKSYFHIDFGTSSVWPKRFEIGYLFPLIDKFFYQNNIGDFDNIGMFGNLKVQKPGLGYIWASLFLDEVNLEKDFFVLDREMFAYQAGAALSIPSLSFGRLTLSYTKIEPYCYTHPKTGTPWYKTPMEEAYLNHGYGIGYYLPPNSDEIRLRFEFAPLVHTMFNAQFQMIRHGADYGSSAVNGSSYLSELTGTRAGEGALKKYFLQDGAYQWFYILKVGGKHKLKDYPVEFFAEAGFVFSYWTNIDGTYSNDGPHSFQIVDSAEYPQRNAVIASLGVRIFK
ncbi:MAG: hypothetical protein LBV68_00060 [Spirochaetaceae bacterium]|jgi:hypothetical protein|nr:hypothetical protein [Spirochaetaceae bacterium]